MQSKSATELRALVEHYTHVVWRLIDEGASTEAVANALSLAGAAQSDLVWRTEIDKLEIAESDKE